MRQGIQYGMPFAVSLQAVAFRELELQVVVLQAMTRNSLIDEAQQTGISHNLVRGKIDGDTSNR